MDYGKVIKMDELARSMFESAILKEQLAHKMYTRLSEKTNIKTIKDLLLNIAEEELIHERLFKKMDISVLKIINSSDLKKLNLLKNIDKIKLLSDEIEEINKTLDFAISEEQRAHNDYNLIAKHLNFGEARNAFEQTALQEIRHKNLLQKIKLEFNDNDWKLIKR